MTRLKALFLQKSSGRSFCKKTMRVYFLSFDLLSLIWQILLAIYCQWELVVQDWFWSLWRHRQPAAARGGRCPTKERSRAERAHADSSAPARWNTHLSVVVTSTRHPLMSWTETFAAILYSMCNTVKSKFAQQLSDVPCLLFDVFTMLLRGKCLQKSTCLQSEDLDDRLEDPGKAGKSGLSDTSASN